MENIIIVIVLLLIVGGIILYLWKAKNVVKNALVVHTANDAQIKAIVLVRAKLIKINKIIYSYNFIFG